MLDISRVITEVLVHTHLQGIIHGTLHPGHVLVGPHREIKVMDLGLSWILMDILSECDVDLLRPLYYLPPELAKGELLSVSSDLYCLGLMMYHMLTQAVPYEGLPKTSIMGRLTFDQSDPEFVFPEEVPPVICQLIQDLTRHNMQDRVQEATHVLTIIDQQLAKLSPAQRAPFSSSSVTQRTAAKAPSKPSQPDDLVPPENQESTLRRTPPVQRPNHQMKYDQVRRNKILQKLGFVLGLALLICGAIAGYWYRDVMDTLPTKLYQQTLTPQTPEPASGPSMINPNSQPSSELKEEGSSPFFSDQVPGMARTSEPPTSTLTPNESGPETQEGIHPTMEPHGEDSVPGLEPQTKNIQDHNTRNPKSVISGSPVTTSPVSETEARTISPSGNTSLPGQRAKQQSPKVTPIPANIGTGETGQHPRQEPQEKTMLHTPSLREESVAFDPTPSQEGAKPGTNIGTSLQDSTNGPESASPAKKTATTNE